MTFLIVLFALPSTSRIVAVNFPNTVTISGSFMSTFIFSIKSPGPNVTGKTNGVGSLGCGRWSIIEHERISRSTAPVIVLTYCSFNPIHNMLFFISRFSVINPDGNGGAGAGRFNIPYNSSILACMFIKRRFRPADETSTKYSL